MLFTALDSQRDKGLLLLRCGIGGLFIYHGLPKLLGGPEKWAAVGSSMELFGITFLHEFWGFMAGFAETFGGLGLVLGAFLRPAAAMLLFTMFVAVSTKIAGGESFAYPFAMAVVIASLILMGTGRFGLDEKLAPRIDFLPRPDLASRPQ
jgi:putative oxidoreductase